MYVDAARAYPAGHIHVPVHDVPHLPPTWADLVGMWHPDPFGLVVAGLLLGGYGAAVVVLLRRGIRWPRRRTLAVVAAALSVLAVTCTGVGAYATALFSVHMVQHMVLNMVTPLFLALAAPVTLALRVLPVPARRGLLRLLHSRAARVVSHPAAVVALFALSLYALYFTPLFGALMSTMWGHVLMQVHFLGSGFLFFWFVLDADPNRYRPDAFLRIPVILIAMLSHTLFAVVLVFGRVPLGSDFYAALGVHWPVDRLADQALAGAVAWALGELVTVGVLAGVLIGWFRRREREDRAAALRRMSAARSRMGR